MTNPFEDDRAPDRGKVPDTEPVRGTLPVVESPFMAPDGNPQAPSVEAQSLVDAGATPYVPDVAEMLRQMRELQSRVDTLQAERGIPSDPVEAAVKDLVTHVKARQDANPTFEFSKDLKDQLKYLTENPDYRPDSNAAELLALGIEDAVSRGRHLELSYLTELARNVRREVLKAEGATAKQAERVLRTARV